MPHCFQSEHMFYIKRGLVVGVGGAEGRFKGSSALKDLNLFKVSTLRALTTFHPTQQKCCCPHSQVHVWGLGCGPEGNRMVTSLQIVSLGDITFPLGFDRLPKAHSRAENR